LVGSVFVVVDTMGAGRVVGVFDSENLAVRVIGGFGAYYKLFPANTWASFGQHCHVVLSCSGCLRVVAVTGSKLLATVLASSPYRRIQSCRRNRINADCLGWAMNEDQAAHLACLLREEPRLRP
jgi:hypothetical protein